MELHDTKGVIPPEVDEMLRAGVEAKLRGMSHRNDPIGFKKMSLRVLRWWRASSEAHRAGPTQRGRCDAEIKSRQEDRAYRLKIGGLIVAGITALGLGQIITQLIG